MIESLISVNTRLQQHDAAWGTLLTAREQYDVTQHEEWYERLGKWQEALQAYERKAESDPDDKAMQVGRMECPHALGEWDQLALRVDETWPNATHEFRRAAAWSLHEWDSMDDYIATMTQIVPFIEPFSRFIKISSLKPWFTLQKHATS